MTFRKTMRILVGVIIAVFLSVQAVVAGQQSGFVLPREREPRLSPDELRGEQSYAFYCSLCHGDTGMADGFNSYSLKTPPARLVDRGRMSVLSDEQIRETIRNGGNARSLSAEMPPWGGVLSEQQIAELTTFIRTMTGGVAGDK